jgi:DNA adenine methylase
MIKPLIKWVGGKTQIIDTIIGKFPLEINNYHEIFLGGGSVLLAILSNDTIKIRGTIYAYDINEALIYMYKNIQRCPDELYDALTTIITDFNKCGSDAISLNRKPLNIEEARLSKENYYYWIRSEYNKIQDKRNIICSAMFIFLNKTCFRGLYRIGPNGFNVPYGNYKNPEIINKDHLDAIHHLIQRVEFECYDCIISLTRSQFEPDDFIYLDPPYSKEVDTSFVGYTENGFDDIQLFNKLQCYHDDVKYMMSNSNTELVRHYFTPEKYNIIKITTKRTINSKKPNSKTTELIITN